MNRLNDIIVKTGFILLVSPILLNAQISNNLSEIPRIDVHAHIGSIERMHEYVRVAEILREEFKRDLAIWIDLRAPLEPGGEGIEFLNEVRDTFNGRFLLCLNDYTIDDGLRFSPEELAEWYARGVAGYKIWVGVSPLVDNPANGPTFTKMEQLGLPGASIHISQPYPTEWCDDPVKFWEAHNAWERVLDRHPRLSVVNAHMLDHFYSDEQLDYLRYILDTYPHVNVDLAARFQQFHRMDRENLRDFMIQYADRILFGTDISGLPEGGRYEQTAERYFRCFQLLETDGMIEGGFFGNTPTRGLALPVDVLEKIYFRNAVRLYPGVKEALESLGYAVK
ncbi:amidohydrolase family protein [candidate division KSB1 bacterium]